ncbi:hypothetical protein V5E38_10715 [Rossellomorea sp. GAMAL-10_SWC]
MNKEGLTKEMALYMLNQLKGFEDTEGYDDVLQYTKSVTELFASKIMIEEKYSEAFNEIKKEYIESINEDEDDDELMKYAHSLHEYIVEDLLFYLDDCEYSDEIETAFGGLKKHVKYGDHNDDDEYELDKIAEFNIVYESEHVESIKSRAILLNVIDDNDIDYYSINSINNEFYTDEETMEILERLVKEIKEVKLV